MLRIPAPGNNAPERGIGGKLRQAVALIALLFGSLLLTLGRVCTDIGQLWGGLQLRNRVERTFAHFYSVPRRASAARRSAWEERLWRTGPAIILCIMSVLVLMWLFMLLGGTLAWLAFNGYGFWLLLGAVILGTVIGLRLGRGELRPSQDSRMN